jgi:dipeptidyl aminopeptidase/acylaminoacyl peptidase
LLVQTHEDGGAVWRLLSLKDGSFGPSMAEFDSLEAPIEDRLTYRMIGGVRLDDSAHYFFFDPRIRAVWGSIVDGFSDEQLEFVSASADFGKVVVKVNGPIHGYMYVLMDMSTHRGTPVGEVYTGVGVPLETKRLTYPAADGLQIPAYLTFPRGKPPKNLPLIVFPHGGPAARDSAEFDWWNRYMGVTGPSDPLLQQFSPIKHVNAINVPVLLVHGRDDSVVSFDQSTAMLDAMKHAKKEVEMVVLKNEDHWLSRSETRLQMLQSSVAFLRAHNPPD